MTGCVADGPAAPPPPRVVEGRPADGASEELGAPPLLLLPPAAGTVVELGLGTVRVVKRVVVVYAVVVESTSAADGDDEAGTAPEPVGEVVAPLPPSVMGQTVVLTAMISVVTWPILPGQSVTVAAQLVMV